MKQAILSGINNDLGSGSNVDMFVHVLGIRVDSNRLCCRVVIRSDLSSEFFRNCFTTEIPQKKAYEIKFQRGDTGLWPN